MVTYYLEESGVIPYLETLGFSVVGYGNCTIYRVYRVFFLLVRTKND